MARLCTEDELRERFNVGPEAVGRELGLTADELRQLEQLSARQLGHFAASLRHKRLNGIGKLLPLTRAALGERFAALFRRYAGTYTPSGIRKHRDDALAFAAFVERLARAEPLEPVRALDQLRYETAWLQAADATPCCVVRLLRPPVATRLGPGGAAAHLNSVWPALAIWLRFTPRGRLRHAIWSLAR
jgi:hypothetical protein